MRRWRGGTAGWLCATLGWVQTERDHRTSWGGSLFGSLPWVPKPPHQGFMPVPLKAAQHPHFTSKPTSSSHVVVPRCLRKVGIGWGG